MIKTMTAALATMALAGSAWAQTTPTAPAAPAPAPQVAHGQPIDAPLLEGATAAPDCGGLYNLAGQAFCVTAPLANVGALAQLYIDHFKAEGWLVAAGDENRVVFVKRKDGGGCDGMQLQAFYDVSRPAVPEAPGFIGMATIPGDVCAGQTVPAEAPAQ